jgi:hypothetical protein
MFFVLSLENAGIFQALKFVSIVTTVIIIVYFATEEEEEEYEESLASQKNEVQNVIKSLAAKLEDLQTCFDLIVKHGAALQRSLSELESLDTAQDVPTKFKSVNERATLFRITSNAMINVSVLSSSKKVVLKQRFYVLACIFTKK